LLPYSRDICSAKRVAVDLCNRDWGESIASGRSLSLLSMHYVRVETSSAVRKLGQGKLDTRIAVEGEDESLCWG